MNGKLLLRVLFAGALITSSSAFSMMYPGEEVNDSYIRVNRARFRVLKERHTSFSLGGHQYALGSITGDHNIINTFFDKDGTIDFYLWRGNLYRHTYKPDMSMSMTVIINLRKN